MPEEQVIYGKYDNSKDHYRCYIPRCWFNFFHVFLYLPRLYLISWFISSYLFVIFLSNCIYELQITF